MSSRNGVLFLCVCSVPLVLLSSCKDESGTSTTSPQARPIEQSEQTAAENSPPPKGGLLSGLDFEESSTPNTDDKESGIRFSDVHEQSGIDFVYDNGASDQRLMTEATSGGCGWLDYDKDGWPDLYFPQGGDSAASNWDDQPTDRLYRNLQSGKFLDVTEKTGVTDFAYGSGVCAADFDNDGFTDFYVTNVGPDVLFHNLGDGTFENITNSALIENPLWASSAAWGDLDLDGDLDLYVCNYVDYDPRKPIACYDEKGEPGTCHPKDIDPMFNRVYFNQGDGTFVDEADKRGLNGPGSKSLGVVIADFTGDQLPDVYVANDTEANHFFVNRGQGKFEERGILLGCAMSGFGNPQASMGIAYGDYDRNGWPDMYVAHFTNDSNTLYQNLGSSGFTDSTREAGLHLPTLPFLAFGTVMSDFDLDGWQDLFIANGHVDDWRERTGDAWWMKSQMFTYDGHNWAECSKSAGPYFQIDFLGRAAASADYDRDGRLDLVVVNQSAATGLLHNESKHGHWLQLNFVGQQSNRTGIGAEVTVEQKDLKLVAQLPGGTSYCASHQPILSFGFGDSDEPCKLSVKWPNGQKQVIDNVRVDQLLTLFEIDAENK